MCSKFPTTFALFPVPSLGYAHAQLSSLYLLSTFGAFHMTKNTRLSTPAQLQCLCSGMWEPGNEARKSLLKHNHSYSFLKSAFIDLFILFVCFFVCLFVCFFVCFFLCFFVCFFVSLFVSLFLCLFVSLFLCLFVSLFLCLFLCFFVCLFLCFFVCFCR